MQERTGITLGEPPEVAPNGPAPLLRKEDDMDRWNEGAGLPRVYAKNSQDLQKGSGAP